MEERGKDINLYDWFQAFVMVVDNTKSDVSLTTSSKNAKKKKKIRGKNP